MQEFQAAGATGRAEEPVSFFASPVGSLTQMASGIVSHPPFLLLVLGFHGILHVVYGKASSSEVGLRGLVSSAPAPPPCCTS
jgi:hypothetical protein